MYVYVYVYIYIYIYTYIYLYIYIYIYSALPPSLLIFTPIRAPSQSLALALYALALTLLHAPAIALSSSLSCGRSGTNCRASTKRSRCRLSWRHFLLVPSSQGRYDVSHSYQ